MRRWWTLVLMVPSLAWGNPETWCESFEDTEPGLLYSAGVSPTTLDGRADQDVVDGLWTDRNDPWLRRISVVRTMIWNNTLSYRVNSFGMLEPGAGTWRTGMVSAPGTPVERILPVVHWQDLDDSSWTFWFIGQRVCAVVSGGVSHHPRVGLQVSMTWS